MTKARKKGRKKEKAEAAEARQASRARWRELMAGEAEQEGPFEINADVQQALRESYRETNKDLQFYAEKVRFLNDLKRRIREELSRLRRARGRLAPEDPAVPDKPIEPVAVIRFDRHPTFDDDGRAVVNTAEGTPAASRAALEAEIDHLEERLASIGDDAQLANVDMQDMLQKQQRTLQMMSNISKVLHDSAMAVIRKIG